VQAAMGLLQLKYIDSAIEKRKAISEFYQSKLIDVAGIDLPMLNPLVDYNYSYFPIFVNKDKYGKSRDELYDEMKRNNIYGRRYFYPLISQFSTYRGLESSQSGNLPNSEKVAQRVICLPIYPDMSLQNAEIIIKIIRNID
jgi:dTDP-4-amino-4,6-dideoxygalactose transaminase